MTRIDAAALLPAARLREAVLDGEITQLHRGDAHAAEGDTFTIDSVEYEITDVSTDRLGDLTDADARAEGSPTLEAYRQRIETVHGTEWDDDRTAVRHRFERRE